MLLSRLDEASKDSKDSKDSKYTKDSKDGKDSKDSKDSKIDDKVIQVSSFNLEEIIKKLPQPDRPDNIQCDTQDSSEITKRKYNTTKPKKNTLSNNNKYTEIPKDQIKSLPLKTYIRYVDIDDNAPQGGRISKIENDDANSDVNITMNIYNSQTRCTFKRDVKLSTISQLFVFIPNNKDKTIKEEQFSIHDTTEIDEATPPIGKTSDDNLIEQLGGKILFENNNDMLKDRVETIENTVKKLEDDLKKIFILVKRLYARK